MASKKCVLCGEFILNINEAVPYKNERYAHDRCFKSSLKAIQINKSDKINQAKKEKRTESNAKAKAELKDAISEEEYQFKKLFYEYLNNVLGIPSSAKIYTLVDKYKNTYNCDFELMYKTLVYLNDIADIELTGDVVGLIPYYYDEADRWFKKIEQLEQQNQNINMGNMYKEQTIQITKSQKRKKNLIDISSI